MPYRSQMHAALFLGWKVEMVESLSRSCRTVLAREGRRFSQPEGLPIAIRAVPRPVENSLSPIVDLAAWVSQRFGRWPLKSSFAGQKWQLPYTTLDTLKGNWTTKRSQFELLIGPRQGEA